jgi:predicted GIY-YIG superfamily endonuclease
MAMEDSSIGSMEGTQNQVAECSRQVNRNLDCKSQSTLSFLTTTPPASTCFEKATPKKKENVEEKQTIKKENKKGKKKLIDREEVETQSSSTTDKLVALISHISTRLDQIEKNIGIGPDRS